LHASHPTIPSRHARPVHNEVEQVEGEEKREAQEDEKQQEQLGEEEDQKGWQLSSVRVDCLVERKT
jgi:hypothetical protein